ncbi:hypothetical protein EYC84_003524 [Monilinia fructicola]|uniref:Uncharacterized protein n=1 Tax=Monilinia fructicola TaxID=38448 RepID=A0A5M9JXU6_MONFR|nr:hypothetical protein EYC84_003524 [Monilinia fructicola]
MYPGRKHAQYPDTYPAREGTTKDDYLPGIARMRFWELVPVRGGKIFAGPRSSARVRGSRARKKNVMGKRVEGTNVIFLYPFPVLYYMQCGALVTKWRLDLFRVQCSRTDFGSMFVQSPIKSSPSSPLLSSPFYPLPIHLKRGVVLSCPVECGSHHAARLALLLESVPEFWGSAGGGAG